MGMPKIRHVHGHDHVGMPMDMPTLTCPGMSTGMPGLACQGSSIHPDMHTDMQGRHAQGHTGRRGHASRMRRLRADGGPGVDPGRVSLVARRDGLGDAAQHGAERSRVHLSNLRGDRPELD